MVRSLNRRIGRADHLLPSACNCAHVDLLFIVTTTTFLSLKSSWTSTTKALTNCREAGRSKRSRQVCSTKYIPLYYLLPSDNVCHFHAPCLICINKSASLDLAQHILYINMRYSNLSAPICLPTSISPNSTFIGLALALATNEASRRVFDIVVPLDTSREWLMSESACKGLPLAQFLKPHLRVCAMPLIGTRYL